MKKIAIAATAALLAIGTMPTAALAQSSSSEVAKNGSCPTGFKASGSNCVSSSKVAIAKDGSCPTGWRASSNYCTAGSGEYAEMRSGSCPTGLKASGKYCIK